MKLDLTRNDIFTLLTLVERELERGTAALIARDVDGCLNACPPRSLLPLKAALEAAAERCG
jgi:hypothetical protein